MELRGWLVVFFLSGKIEGFFPGSGIELFLDQVFDNRILDWSYVYRNERSFSSRDWLGSCFLFRRLATIS